jgi:hypothetical protein
VKSVRVELSVEIHGVAHCVTVRRSVERHSVARRLSQFVVRHSVNGYFLTSFLTILEILATECCLISNQVLAAAFEKSHFSHCLRFFHYAFQLGNLTTFFLAQASKYAYIRKVLRTLCPAILATTNKNSFPVSVKLRKQHFAVNLLISSLRNGMSGDFPHHNSNTKCILFSIKKKRANLFNAEVI